MTAQHRARVWLNVPTHPQLGAKNGDQWNGEAYAEGEQVVFLYIDAAGNLYESTEEPQYRRKTP